ncbi:MAG: Dabb family protein [Dissulfurispiraceae bacterium]|jgi:quinol monooxygenase YgiN
MVKHVVMWRLKDRTEGGSKKENASTVKQMFEDLNGKIPGMIKLEVGIDYAMSDASSCIVLYSEFVDEEALDGYRAHPEFKRASAFIKSVSAERRMVDYVV